MNPPTTVPGGPPASLYGPIEHADYGYGRQVQATAAAALSQPSPAHDGAALNSRKRKASGAPGSRGVANLTPEQLAKKRANDREAQRAIRERTRNTIESLERRIRELESQQPYQELQRAIAERDRALAECEQLKGRLTQVAEIVGTGNPRLNGEFMFDDFINPNWLNEGDAELASLIAQQTPLLPPQHHHSPLHAAVTDGAQAYEQQQHLHPDLRSPHPSTHASPADSTLAVHHAGEDTPKTWSPSLEQQQRQQYLDRSQHLGGLPSHNNHHQPQASHQNNGERLGLNFLLGSTQHGKGSLNGHTATVKGGAPPALQPLYPSLPTNSRPSCPLDGLLLDFIDEARQELAAGVSMEEVIGPEYPSLTPFYDPNPVHLQNLHPLSALLVNMRVELRDIKTVPENVAVYYITFLLMRWWICPCEERYARLPEWIRPLPEQLECAHARRTDIIAW